MDLGMWMKPLYKKKENKGKPFYFVLVSSSALSFKNILRKLHNDFTNKRAMNCHLQVCNYAGFARKIVQQSNKA